MPIQLHSQVSLAPYTTLRVGGSAQHFIVVESAAELAEAVAYAQANGLPFLCIGGGSNLLVADAGYPGVAIVLRLAGRTYEEQADGTVRVTIGAGEVFDAVIADTVERGWWGLENLSHIPGSVGATPVQNVGAYGVEMSDVVTAVEVFDTTQMTARWLTPAECRFGYRHSIFKMSAGASLVVLRVQVRLQSVATPKLEYADLAALASSPADVTPEQVRAAVIAIRNRKFPDWTTVGTAGSFFMNPIIPTVAAQALRAQYPNLPVHVVSETESKVSLGYVLDKICQRKGYRRGNVALSEAQALVLIAYPGATATEILDFAAHIAADVAEKTGLQISREVRYVE